MGADGTNHSEVSQRLQNENLGRCGRQNMIQPYLKIWEWEWIFGRAVKVISSPGVRSPWPALYMREPNYTPLFNETICLQTC